MNEKTAQIDVNHSRPLDVHLWSDYAEINDLVKSIFDSFSSEEKLQIKSDIACKAFRVNLSLTSSLRADQLRMLDMRETAEASLTRANN